MDSIKLAPRGLSSWGVPVGLEFLEATSPRLGRRLLSRPRVPKTTGGRLRTGSRPGCFDVADEAADADRDVLVQKREVYLAGEGALRRLARATASAAPVRGGAVPPILNGRGRRAPDRNGAEDGVIGEIDAREPQPRAGRDPIAEQHVARPNSGGWGELKEQVDVTGGGRGTGT